MLPSIAISLRTGEPWYFETARAVAIRVAKEALARGIPPGVLLNVNVPNIPLDELRGVRITRQDPAPYDTHVLTRKDKWGRPYYWIGGKRLDTPDRESTDLGAIQANYVSITPLHSDMTHYETMTILGEWELGD